MALNSTATHAANSSNQARPFSPWNDHDLEAGLSIGHSSAAATSNQGLFSSDDHDRETAVSMALNGAATLVQVIYQGQRGIPNLVYIVAVVVSLFAHLGHQYFSRASISGARMCSSVALFSAALAIASLLAMPLRGVLKCIPYAVCLFPLVSLLSSLFPRSNLFHDPCGWFFLSRTQPQQEETDQEMPPPTSSANPATIRSSMETAPPPTVDDAAANITVHHDEYEAWVADEGLEAQVYYGFFS